MPAELIANFDTAVLVVAGFWRFVFSRRYRASTLTRWRQRDGLAHLATGGEILAAVFFGVALPLTAGYILFIRSAP